MVDSLIQLLPQDPRLNRTLRLPDGRIVGYAEFGDPGGLPCFFFHGIPGSRLGAQLVGDLARHAGIRIIGVDRPGCGLSTFQPGRRFLDWPADVEVLADTLGFERFAVVGISGGGGYVAACAYAIPERLTAAGIVSGMGPLDLPGVSGAYMRGRAISRVVLGLAREIPWMMRQHLERRIARRGTGEPDDLVARIAASMSPPDRNVLLQAGIGAAFVADFQEAVRQGSRGMVWDLLLYARSWGFRLEDIGMPVSLWHGEADIDVPVAFGRAVASRIPNCRATYYPGEGHLIAVTHMREILEVMVAAMRRIPLTPSPSPTRWRGERTPLTPGPSPAD